MCENKNDPILLEDWELICDKCEGKGGSVYDHPSSEPEKPQWIRCQKCQGVGKVDWVENIVGRKPQFTGGSSNSSGFFKSSFSVKHYDIDKSTLDHVAQLLANEIDKKILESLRCESEQIDMKMKKAATIMSEIGG